MLNSLAQEYIVLVHVYITCAYLACYFQFVIKIDCRYAVTRIHESLIKVLKNFFRYEIG